MLRTERVAIEEHTERRTLEDTMRPAFRQTRSVLIGLSGSEVGKPRFPLFLLSFLRHFRRTLLALKGSLRRAIPRAPLTAAVRSADASCLRRKGEERKTNTKTNIVRFST
jgi:hypothetical protein